MALKKEIGEVEIRLSTEQAKQQIKDLDQKARELEKAIDAVGTGNQAERKQLYEQLQANRAEVLKLRESIKTDMRVIINGEVAGKTLRDLNAALTVLKREYRSMGEAGDTEGMKKIAGQIVVIENQVRKLNQPLKEAREQLNDFGEEGSVEQLEAKLKRLNAEYKSMGNAGAASLEKVALEIAKTEQQLEQLRAPLEAAKKSLASIAPPGSLDAMNAELKELVAEYNALGGAGNEDLKQKAAAIAALEKNIAELNAPLKEARGNIKDLGEEGSLTRLRAEADKLREELAGVAGSSQRFATLAIQLDKTEQQIEELTAATRLSKAEFTEIGQIGSLTYLRAKAEALRAEIKLLAPATQEFVEKSKRLREVEGEFDKLNRKVEGTNGIFSFLTKEVKQFGMLAAGYLGFQAITSQISNIINRNAEMSDSLTSVAKTTGLADGQVKNLAANLRRIDTRSSQKDLLDLAYVAGKLGISAEQDVLAFVKAADKIKVSLARDLGGNVEDAINNIGKLTSLFKVREKFGIEESMLRVGSAINELGASSEANEAYLVDFTKRFGGIAPNANISIQDVLGLAATLDKLGQTSEVSTTAIGQLLVAMGKDVPAFAKIAGEGTDLFKQKLIELGEDGATRFAELLEKDANKALIVLLENLKSTRGGVEGMAQKLNALGIDGSRAAGVVGVLSNNIADLKKQQALSNEEFAKGTSLTKEFDKANTNFAAQLEKLQKNIARIFVNSGTQQFFAGIVKGLTDLTDGSSELDKVTTAFKNAKQASADYEKVLPPLINRYEELKSKSSLTKDEQGELKSIIDRIAAAIPTAITEFDRYGNALDINSKKARDFGSSLREMMEIKNKDALTQARADLADLRKSIEQSVAALNSRDAEGYLVKTIAETKKVGSEFETVTKQVRLTNEEVLKLQEGLARKQSERRGYEQLINDLAGVKLYADQAADSLNKIKGGTVQGGTDTTNTESNTTSNTETNTVTNTENNNINLNVNTNGAEKSLLDFKSKIQALQNEIGKTQIDIVTEAATKESAVLANSYEASRAQALQNNAAMLQQQKELLEKKEITREQYTSRVQEYESNTNVLLLAINEKYEIDRRNLALKYREQLSTDELAQDNANLTEKYNQEKLILTQNYAAGIITKQEYDERIENLDLATFETRLRYANEYWANSKANLEKNYAAEKAALDKNLADNKISQQEYNRQLEDLDNFTADQKIEIAKRFGKTVLELEQAIAEGKIKIHDGEVTEYLNKEAEKLRLQTELAQDGSNEQLQLTIQAIEKERDEKTAQYKGDEEMRLLYESEANKKIEEARRAHTQKLLGYAQQAATQLTGIYTNYLRILENKDQAELQKDKKQSDKKRELYQKQLESNIITKEEYNAKIDQLDTELDRKQAEMRKKAFIRQKRFSIIQALINTALGVTQALSSYPPPASYVLAAITAAAGAIEVAAIASQPVPEFKFGKAAGQPIEKGKGGIAKGPSHAEGGLDIINPNTKERVGNMEGDEMIVNKQAVADNPEVSRLLMERSYAGGGKIDPSELKKVVILDSVEKIYADTDRRKFEFGKPVGAIPAVDEGRALVNFDGPVNERPGRALVNVAATDPEEGRALVNFDGPINERTGRALVNVDGEAEGRRASGGGDTKPEEGRALVNFVENERISNTVSSYAEQVIAGFSQQVVTAVPKFTQQAMQTIDVPRIVQNIAIERLGYSVATNTQGGDIRNVQQPFEPAGNNNNTGDKELKERMLAMFERMEATLKQVEETHRQPVQVRSKIVLRDLQDAQDLEATARRNAQIG